MALLQVAQQWVDEGVAAIPIQYQDKRPHFRLIKEVAGDTSWRTFQRRLPSREEVGHWFRSRFVNLGLVTGWRNMVVLDFDTKPAWHLWEAWADLVGGEAKMLKDEGYRVETGKGVHLYCTMEEPPEGTLKVRLRGRQETIIDIKANGYVLAPPSLHPTGRVYQGLGGKVKHVSGLAAVMPAFVLESDLTAPDNSIWIASRPSIWEPERPILELFPQANGHGRYRKTLCPFHADRNPSFWIDTQANRCGCFGCDVGTMNYWTVRERLS